MKTFFLFACLLVFADITRAQAPWEKGRLLVSENSRYLKHSNGDPFFYLGDTGWLIFHKLTRDEAGLYFANRKNKGFNVVQCILQFLSDENVYGDHAFHDNDLSLFNTTPGNDPQDTVQYDFWDHVDHLADVAAENGIYLAIVPVWGQYVKRASLSTATAEEYARQLALRYRMRPNIIWVNGGGATGDFRPELWNAIGSTMKQYDSLHLMTFHTFGRTQSSTWFQNAPWLDFNMFTSGHRRYDQDDTPKKYGEDNWRYVFNDLGKTPHRPTLDGEPSYEATPQGLHDITQPYWTASDVRRSAYWSVFAGACGHTYGHNSVRQVYKRGEIKPASGAKTFFHEALDDMGAFHMQHVRDLVLSRPYFDRINDQSVVAVDEGTAYDRILVSRGKNYLMAYTSTGRAFNIHMGKISGSDIRAWWFNPRTGTAAWCGMFPNRGTVLFKPPGERAPGNDWVLVLDDASTNFTAPGLK